MKSKQKQNEEYNNQNNNNELNNDENDHNKDKKREENDPALNLINSHRHITNEEKLKSPILVMKEEEGKILNGKEIIINAGGMINGRNKNDGVTIFSNSNSNKNKNFKPDFQLNFEEKLNYPYIFAIYYKRETKNYFIRAYSGKNSDNRLLYIKLNQNYNLSLKQKEIISAGNVIFQVSPLQNNKIEIINLSKKDIKDKGTIFSPDETKEITIGRDKNSNFPFPKDKSFSRIQTTFYFNDNIKEWVIFDGNKNKSSTNGTWIFGTHSFLIKDQLMVEILNSKIKFTIKENEG